MKFFRVAEVLSWSSGMIFSSGGKLFAKHLLWKQFFYVEMLLKIFKNVKIFENQILKIGFRIFLELGRTSNRVFRVLRGHEIRPRKKIIENGSINNLLHPMNKDVTHSNNFDSVLLRIPANALLYQCRHVWPEKKILRRAIFPYNINFTASRIPKMFACGGRQGYPYLLPKIFLNLAGDPYWAMRGDLYFQ